VTFRRTALLLLLGGLILVSGQPSRAAQPDFEAVDAFVREALARHRMPGLALAIVRGDEIAYLRGYGSAGEGRPMTARTPLYIGSISKSFTALAVMQRVEAGEIDLDAPVRAYLPWFRVADEGAGGRTSETLTVRQLLHQTSGLAEETYMADLPSGTTLEAAVRDLQHAAPVDPPGTAFHYFNQNYTTLGRLVEEVSGRAYGDYVREEILAPLAMDRSAATPEGIADLNAAQGHGVLFGYPIPRAQGTSAHTMPEGGLVSTAEDMAHYLIAQLNGGAYGGTRILSAEGIAALQRPETPGAPPGEGYGMGWIVEPWEDTRVVRHGGSLENFRSFAWLLPAHDYGFVILINQNGFVPAMLAYSEIPAGIAALLTGDEPETGLSMRMFYGIATAVFLLVAVLDVRGWLRVIRRKASPERSKARRVARAVGGLVRAGVFYALPYGLLAAMDRGFSWSLGWTMAPTGVIFIGWNVAMGAGKGLVRAWRLIRGRGQASTSFENEQRIEK
jgi:CubicO group peptidase (beta-lactamase class C family)